jgi:hypothetical protein
MILKLTNTQLSDLITVLDLYQMSDDLITIEDSRRVIRGQNYLVVYQSLFGRLKVPLDELTDINKFGGRRWAGRLAQSIKEIIATGEWYPVAEMVKNCEADYCTARDPELQALLEQLHTCKLPAGQDSPPVLWFMGISQI